MKTVGGSFAGLFSIVLFAAVPARSETPFPAKGSGEWFAPSTWAGGVPASGAGAAVLLKSGSPYFYRMTNDVVIGHLVYPSTNAASLGTFTLGNHWYGSRKATDEYPSHDGWAFGVHRPGTLTFEKDASDAHATFANDTPEAIRGQPSGSYMAVLHPVVLKSDLAIRGLGRRDANVIANPTFTMAIVGPISEEGGHYGISVDIGITATSKVTDPCALYGPYNDFTGDVHVERGNLRVVACDRFEVEDATPFGHHNSIYATNGLGSIDIGPYKTGATQHLYIGGNMPCSTYGQIFSTYSDATFFPEWAGPITLVADAAVGGRPPNNATGYAKSNLLLSGPIDEEGEGRILTICGASDIRLVALTGANTYSGGTKLAAGLVSAGVHSLGTGPVTFSGGIYRYDGPGSCDISTLGVSGKVYIEVPEGVTYEPAQALGAFTGLSKRGKGTLVLAHANSGANGPPYIYEGELVLDYAADSDSRFNATQNCIFYAKTTLRVRNLPSDASVISHYLVVQPNSWCDFINESEGARFKLNRLTRNVGAVANVVTPDTFLCGLSNGGATSINPGFVSPTVLYMGRSWVKQGSGSATLEFTDFSSSWSADPSSRPVVDISASNASAPAGAVASCIRFNDPSCGTLVLGGDTTLYGGVILVTEAMGSTPVTIRGGRLLTASTSNPIHVINMNTNAPVTIESDIAVVDNAAGPVCVAGPGPVRLHGDNSFLGSLYVNNCDLEIDRGSAIGTVASANGAKSISFGANCSLTFTGSMILAQPAASGTGVAKVGMSIGADGVTFSIPNASDVVTVTTNRVSSSIGELTGGRTAPIVFSGPGTFAWDMTGKSSADIVITNGATIAPATLGNFVHDNGGIRPITVHPGSTLKHAGFAQAGIVFRGSGCGIDAPGFMPLRFTGDFTLDLNGTSATLGARSSSLGAFSRMVDAWIGTGTVSIANSAAATPTINPNGFRSARFSGRLVSDVAFNGEGGMELPDVEFVAKEGVNHWFKNWSENESLWFGALSGSGGVCTRIANYNQNLGAGSGGPDLRDQRFYLGRDRPDEVADFSGELDMGQLNDTNKYVSTLSTFAKCGAPRLVKIGTNTQRLSGSRNWIVGSPTVRGGRLLIGADSLPASTNGYRGALGKAMVLVGDDETASGAEPRLLIDGGYTVANNVNVPSISPADALPGVGGTATCEYTGEVKLFRQAALVAEGADSVVTFDSVAGAAGEDSSQRAGIVMSGAGTVVIKSLSDIFDFGCDDAGGLLTVEDDIALPADARFVFTGDARNLEKTRHVIATAESISGGFASVEGLPEGWSLRVGATTISLGRNSCTMILVR